METIFLSFEIRLDMETYKIRSSYYHRLNYRTVNDFLFMSPILQNYTTKKKNNGKIWMHAY